MNIQIKNTYKLNFAHLAVFLLSISFWACDTKEDSKDDPTAASACPPQDEECALFDADGDGVLNGVDDFPLDARCSELSNENCESCGTACASGLFCQRKVLGGVFRGGECLPASQEVCNEQDDDGDGITDEGPPADNQRGVCGGSRKICSESGVFENPDYAAIDGYADGQELCDDKDNDCDGFIDEAPRALKILGVCQGLDQVCVDGAFQEPDYESLVDYSAVELCDGLDNDCDGEIDEDIPGVGLACGAGVGGCFEEGITLCRPLEERIVCSVTGGTPGPEACNGRDDDCDGRTDEQLPNTGMACTVGQGSCAVEGRLICADETGVLICDASPTLPQQEACNGIDDDCDGQIDEESLGAGEGCHVGVGACARFGIYTCDTLAHELVCSQSPSEPVAEVCNNVDDDCDGRVDEGIPTVGDGCTIGQGLCRSQGVFTCDGANSQIICNADVIAPGEEECNDIDDDCDGTTDEEAMGVGELCTVGTGACTTESELRCDSERRELVCDASPSDGQEESCNDIDDDCDGAIDEGTIVRYDEVRNIEWVCVKGGDFLMGWNERLNERPIHPVRVPTFEMARAEVTVAQYLQCVLGNVCDTPINNDSNWHTPGRSEHPINSLSWPEANEIANFLDGRLPTEAEWEFAARKNRNEARYPWGVSEPSCDLANHNDGVQGDGCGTGTTAPVCSRGPLGNNALGICDMSGNVWEWVADGYSPNYNSTPTDGSAAVGVAASKVIRGGGWRSGPETLTSTYRLEMSPSIRNDYIGVRIVRSVGESNTESTEEE